MYFTLQQDFRVTLTAEPPIGGSWKQIVTFRDAIAEGDKKLVLAAAFPQRPFTLPRVGARYQTSVLKSNLQKAVRRGKVEAAVATAFQMACQGSDDLTELFRRLPIILVEDTLLNSKVLARWTWWMLATTKGWILSDTEWKRLLADLAYVAATPFREGGLCFDCEDPLPCSSVLAIADEGKRIGLFAVWIRSQWGGMTGDMNMLRGLGLDWLRRPEEDWTRGGVLRGPPHSLLPTFPIFDVGSHALDEAVDFHCCPGMLKDFAEQTGADERDIKRAIWEHRSSLNVRELFLAKPAPLDSGPALGLDLLSRCNFDRWIRSAWRPQSRPKSLQGSMIAFLKPVEA
jgi:hypothetical protein